MHDSFPFLRTLPRVQLSLSRLQATLDLPLPTEVPTEALKQAPTKAAVHHVPFLRTQLGWLFSV